MIRNARMQDAIMYLSGKYTEILNCDIFMPTIRVGSGDWTAFKKCVIYNPKEIIIDDFFDGILFKDCIVYVSDDFPGLEDIKKKSSNTLFINHAQTILETPE